MTDMIMVPLIMGIITWGVYSLFELFARRRERLTIIEKMGDKIEPSLLSGYSTFPSFQSSQSEPSKISYATLRIACLLIGLGMGFIAGFILDYTIVINREYYQKEIIYPACVLLFGGLGLLSSFFIETTLRKKE